MKDHPLDILEDPAYPQLPPLDFSGSTYPFTFNILDSVNMAFMNREEGVTVCGYNPPDFSCKTWNLFETDWQDSGAGEICSSA